jgi:hypothetical protein
MLQMTEWMLIHSIVKSMPKWMTIRWDVQLDITDSIVGIARLRLQITSHTGNADSLHRTATACRWGFHKLSGIAHFIAD